MFSGGSNQQNNVASTPSPESTESAAKAFPCSHCPKRFRSYVALQRHSNGHHPAFERCPMQCRFCPFLTSQRREFFQHRRECHPDRGGTTFYCCPLCSKLFRALGTFYDHCLVHMARNEYEGGEDQQDMASVENLQVELAAEDSVDVVRDSGPIEAARLPDLTVAMPGAEKWTSSESVPTVADKSTNLLKSSFVKRPRSNGSMASTIPPSESPAVMASPANSPSNVHQQQTYQCPYCPAKSQVPNWLQVHVYMSHGALFPSAIQVMCGHCDQIETDSANLHVHHLEHHADLPVYYKCPTCGKFYRKIFFYEAHYKSHTIPHLLEKHAIPRGVSHASAEDVSQSFTCPDCSATCADLTGYETHLQEYHAEISIDSHHEADNLELSTNDDPAQRSASDSHPCPLCQRHFVDATKLMSHQEECILTRGMPSADGEAANLSQDDDVILVKQETDCYLTRAGWYRESKVYTCAECNARFDTLALVERHTIAEHCPANLALLYKCTKCGETFEGFAKFQKHSLKHI